MMIGQTRPPSPDLPPPPETFTGLLVNHLREIVEKAFNALDTVASCEHDPFLEEEFQLLLRQGIWSPDDYWRASRKWGLAPTQEMLKNYRTGLVTDLFFSQIRPFTFQLNKGSLPSEAISFIGKELSLLDSGSIYMLAFHKALSEFIGPEKFNQIFRERHFYFSNTPHIRLTSPLFESIAIESSDEIMFGDQCCFKNMLAFHAKHEVREEYFTVCSNAESKLFLGLGLPPEGSTQEAVEQMMLQSYNQPPLQEGRNILAKHTDTWDEFQATQTIPPFRKQGRLYLRVVRPNVEKIAQLAEATLDNVGEVFNAMAQEPLNNQEPLNKKSKTDPMPLLPLPPEELSESL